MKTFLFATLAATVLTASSVFAAPLASPAGPGYPPFEHGRDAYDGYHQGYRPDYQGHDQWDEGHRDAPRYDPERAYGYERSQQDGYYRSQAYGYGRGQGYGYDRAQYARYDGGQRVLVQPQSQFRRPVSVSFHVGMY
ncbi:hypothetical protein GKZ68_21430 (plasmid) [Hymenobacter sp. BRD128]|uniref:hypothetical protein n=1 Tax=Hymenobacter sp. BRD128 TaxID=2675878 RepID=UPI00156555C9|nr:hypothetical protein [Hymenobacter sp. BRD128]QKG59246.1 hypothetical protein GKZ68_21430 [Hymenobacter sp. BRD128]